ncbi:hypothetical protein NKJ09_28335 [Mesorhizobium sp. M0189]|uniref:hypothetical protein n=1 Tax=Mesorhizobium sp. M0189 TaxID=2956909 RepID=UPI003336FD2D
MSSGCAAPDPGDEVVVDRRVADVDPKFGQFRGEPSLHPQCPPIWHGRFYQAVTAALVVGCSTMSDMRHSVIRMIALL